MCTYIYIYMHIYIKIYIYIYIYNRVRLRWGGCGAHQPKPSRGLEHAAQRERVVIARGRIEPLNHADHLMHRV